VRTLERDDDFPFEDEVGVLAGLALRNQRFAGFEREPTGRRNQAREVFLGEIAERARLPSQRRAIPKLLSCRL
jgi:hypothetical protein